MFYAPYYTMMLIYSIHYICYTIVMAKGKGKEEQKETKRTHVALYRKYRPKTFSEVVGQEQAVQVLTESIKQKKISHAYLFCGGRGTGKTTVARIVARDIGCNDEDIIEIDAASNRGIDEIRVLREAVRTAPFSSPYKVYIIDEAHMLTKEAANALLKTLEEPPAHVVFILATTDGDKLPDTIVSRCQKIIFKQPVLDTLAKRLMSVAEGEGKTLGENEALLLARHGKGSYRDALGLLEQILAVSTNAITHDTIVSFLGTPHKDTLEQLLIACASKDTHNIVKAIEKLVHEQVAPLVAYDECIELLRRGLLLRVGEGIVDKEIETLVTQHPTLFVSKHILELLKKRELLEVTDTHAWTAFTAIMLSLIEQ